MATCRRIQMDGVFIVTCSIRIVRTFVLRFVVMNINQFIPFWIISTYMHIKMESHHWFPQEIFCLDFDCDVIYLHTYFKELPFRQAWSGKRKLKAFLYALEKYETWLERNNKPSFLCLAIMDSITHSLKCKSVTQWNFFHNFFFVWTFSENFGVNFDYFLNKSFSFWLSCSSKLYMYYVPGYGNMLIFNFAPS